MSGDRALIRRLKIEHNAAQNDGAELWKQIKILFDKCVALQDEIKVLEGDEYDQNPSMFGGCFFIEDE